MQGRGKGQRDAPSSRVALTSCCCSAGLRKPLISTIPGASTTTCPGPPPGGSSVTCKQPGWRSAIDQHVVRLGRQDHGSKVRLGRQDHGSNTRPFDTDQARRWGRRQEVDHPEIDHTNLHQPHYSSLEHSLEHSLHLSPS